MRQSAAFLSFEQACRLGSCTPNKSACPFPQEGTLPHKLYNACERCGTAARGALPHSLHSGNDSYTLSTCPTLAEFLDLGMNVLP